MCSVRRHDFTMLLGLIRSARENENIGSARWYDLGVCVLASVLWCYHILICTGAAMKAADDSKEVR